MRQNVIGIVSLDAEAAVRRLPEGASLEDRARAAMRDARTHWLSPTEEEAFIGACEGLARAASQEERERIVEDLRPTVKAAAVLGALSSGVPVDFESLGAPKQPESPIGLLGIWQETAAA